MPATETLSTRPAATCIGMNSSGGQVERVPWGGGSEPLVSSEDGGTLASSQYREFGSLTDDPDLPSRTSSAPLAMLEA